CANLQLRFKQDVPGLVHCSRNYAEELEERRRGEELDFLKTFQVRSNEDPQGRPHFTQFSYILKKGDYYEFQMEDDPVLGTEYEFTLSDDNNEPIPLRKVETETGATYHYLSPSSGVVYLNFHNNQGEAGCASMHLKVETEEDREQRLGRGGQNR
ncbi:MAG TPA: hypothetical protein DCP28_00285, partial [Cytophagales bacterium]|nr:hypothetical protein [Cytophagales bacterium]